MDHSHGGPEVLEVREAPEPRAGPGEVRIAVEAAGVNFADVTARAGLYPDAPKPPMVVGYEVSGLVDEVGAGVERLSEGDRVMARTRFGGYSSSVVPAEGVHHVPADVDLRTAAGVQVTYLTSYLMLNRLGSVRPRHRRSERPQPGSVATNVVAPMGPSVRLGCMRISARNQLSGSVVEVVEGVVTTTVKVRLAGGDVVTASITREAAEDLGLAVGGEVTVIVKASDVMLGVK